MNSLIIVCFGGTDRAAGRDEHAGLHIGSNVTAAHRLYCIWASLACSIFWLNASAACWPILNAASASWASVPFCSGKSCRTERHTIDIARYRIVIDLRSSQNGLTEQSARILPYSSRNNEGMRFAACQACRLLGSLGGGRQR